MASSLMQAVLLWYRDEGYSTAEIADRESMSIRSVQLGLRDAEEAEDDLRDPAGWIPPAVPVYGCRPFVRAELTPVEIVRPEPTETDKRRSVVLRRPWEPAPRTHLRHGEGGLPPVEGTPTCPHGSKAIRRGSWIYCERCARSGYDADRRLERDRRTEPRPDPKPRAKSKPPSRRERRALKRLRWNQPPPTGSPRPS